MIPTTTMTLMKKRPMQALISMLYSISVVDDIAKYDDHDVVVVAVVMLMMLAAVGNNNLMMMMMPRSCLFSRWLSATGRPVLQLTSLILDG